ncbi:hypothetical protein CY35_12G036100 [Sphagnum magellanicum]|nr:hypothetical protein CY35_12G036100 [Sphagnum magellanicum]
MSEGIRSKAGAGATQVIIRQQEVNATTTLLAEEEETVTDLPCVKCQLRLLHSFTQPSDPHVANVCSLTAFISLLSWLRLPHD